MTISGSLGYKMDRGKKNRVRRDSLYVFPNKYWFYEDYGSDIFGVRTEMYDYDRNVMYNGAPSNPETRLQPITQDKNKAFDNAPIAVLLETKWLRPLPLKAWAEWIGARTVDVVQTTVNDRRIDFAFDQQTHLLSEVRFHNVVNGKTFVDVQRYSDYVEVDGIKVPQALTYVQGGLEKSAVRFNVEYDENVFLKPPTMKNPIAWISNDRS